MMNLQMLSKYLAMTAFIAFGNLSFAAENAGEKAEASVNKASDRVKEAGRDTQDKACEMVDGKMQCLGKKNPTQGKNSC